MLDFQKDFDHFTQSIRANNSESEIRKEYRTLLKKYHPDLAEKDRQSDYQECILKIVSEYEKYTASEIPSFEEQDNTIYIKLMEVARNEYTEYKKNAVKNHWPINKEQRNHLKNAVKCYEKIIKECKKPELVKAAKNQLEWIQPLYDIQNKEL
ncbi:MAG: DnaJ domain-containing protein [Treponema sp.]|nr:DnaJ domain-containing protein [Treponema sp.]